MKTIYVTTECCTSRQAVFASPEIRRNGDYVRWNYGIRDTNAIAKHEHPIVRSRGAGYDLYIARTAVAVLNLLGRDI